MSNCEMYYYKGNGGIKTWPKLVIDETKKREPMRKKRKVQNAKTSEETA